MKIQVFCILISISSLSFSQKGLLGTDKECKKGLVKKYHENGKLWYTGVNSKDCDEIGEWREYYDNGRLMELINYNNNGDEDGKYEYYFENGKLQETGYYSKGDEKGLWIRYYENGQLEKKANYKNGQKSGDYITYYENGKVSYEGQYKLGEEQGLHKKFYPSGTLLSEIDYNDGEIAGKENYYDATGKQLPPHHTISYDEDFYTTFDKSVKVNGMVIRAYEGYGQPTEYYLNGKLKTSYELYDDYNIETTYYKNGTIKSVTKQGYYKPNGDSRIQINGQNTGITKTYDEQGNLISEVDEDYEEAEKRMTWANESKNKENKEQFLKQAHPLFLKSAEHKNASAMSWLGYNYYYGRGVEQNNDKAIYWFSKALDNGKSVYKDLASAKKIITDKKVAKLKTLESSGTDTALQQQLKSEVENEYKEQLEILLNGYRKDKAAIFMSLSYKPMLKQMLDYHNYFDISTPERTEIQNLYNEYSKSKVEIEDDYNKGIQLAQNNASKEGFDILIRCAVLNHKESQYAVGIMYGSGMGVEIDLDEAIKWSLKAGRNNIMNGYYNASVYLLEQSNAYINQMNALGTSKEDSETWEKLNDEMNELRKEALKHLETIYDTNIEQMTLDGLETMVDLYEKLEIDSFKSQVVKEVLIELKK